MTIENSPFFCNHANEAPNVCLCLGDCYCKTRMCAPDENALLKEALTKLYQQRCPTHDEVRAWTVVAARIQDKCARISEENLKLREMMRLASPWIDAGMEQGLEVYECPICHAKNEAQAHLVNCAWAEATKKDIA